MLILFLTNEKFINQAKLPRYDVTSSKDENMSPSAHICCKNMIRNQIFKKIEITFNISGES